MRVLFRGFGIFSRLLAIALFVGASTTICAAQATSPATSKNKTTNTQEDLPPWKWRPLDLRTAAETNKQALQLTSAVFEARLRRGEVEAKFTPAIAPPDKNDPLSGPNDLGGSPLLQDFGQGAIWLSIILSAKTSDLSPRLQQIQQGLLQGLQQTQTVNPKDLKKEVRKSNRSKNLEDTDAAQDIQRVLRAEGNFQEIVSQLRSAFPKYGELYLHQSPRVLNPPGLPTVFDLFDPVISADPLEKNARMQASLMVKVHRLDAHSFRIVSFWLYRNIEDPEIFVPRALYSEKGKDVTRSNQGLWDGTHMPPRTFSSIGYVSPAVTVLDIKFVDGEPVMTGRSAPAGRRRTQQVSLAGLELDKLDPATEGALDVSIPSFPVSVPEIPSLPALALKNPMLGTDYMPRIREPYEFRTAAEYEAYLAGIREATVAWQPVATAGPSVAAKTGPSVTSPLQGAEPGTAALLAPTNIANPPASTERLNPVFLNPRLEGGLSELSSRARDSLKQFGDLQPVSSRGLINQRVGKSNAGFRNHDKTAELLQQKLPKIRQVNVYFFASDNTTASWRGPDDTSGKGGIVTVLPTRYYSDPQQFYKNVASALINQPLASPDVAILSDYLGGAAARQIVAVKQFVIEVDYVDHGWDEDGVMHKWPDEEVDFLRHLQEAIAYLKPRLETIDPATRSMIEQEIPAVESWLNSLGDGSATLNFGLYKGKDDPPPPKVDSATRTILISCKADEYIKAENRDYRWTLWAKLMEGLNGLHGGRVDPGLASAVYDILDVYGKDKDNKLMIAWRLKADLPPMPANAPLMAGISRVPVATAPLASTDSTTIDAPKAAAAVKAVGDGAAAAVPVAAKGDSGNVAAQQDTAEIAQVSDPKPMQVADPAPAPVADPRPSVAVAESAPKEPALTPREMPAVQSPKPSPMQQADPALAMQISNLISAQMKGIDDSSLRATILQTMQDRLIVVRDPNPNFHSKVSGIDTKQPNPRHFDFTVNKTEYFDALFALAEKDGKARDVIWSSFEANLATVEYAAGNPDFGPLYTALQSDLASTVKRYTNGTTVSFDIFDDPKFKALIPYYASFWSNWQFAGERARFQCLHDRVTANGLRRLAKEAAKSPETKSSSAELLRLADEVDLFYGEAVRGQTALPAIESNAGQRANSLDTAAIANEPEHENNRGTVKPWEIKDYRMQQVITVLQKVQQPGGQGSQYQDSYRRAFMVYQVIDSWNRTDAATRAKLIAGDWTHFDLRFVLPILAEIHAGRVMPELSSADIVKLSVDMPWIADPKFDLNNGALAKLPSTLR